jgi:hypothetical protein
MSAVAVVKRVHRFISRVDERPATMTSAALAGSNLLRKWRYSPRCFQPSRDVPDLPASPKLLGLEASAIGFGMDELRGRDLANFRYFSGNPSGCLR